MAEEPPIEVQTAMVVLAQRQEYLTVLVRPWQAWQVVLVCQHLACSPHLSPVLVRALEEVGGVMEAAIVAAAPEVAAHLAAGWPARAEGAS